MQRSAPTALVVPWIIGIVTTGVWVTLYVGFLAASGLDGEGAEIYATRYFAFLVVAAVAWIVSILIAAITRSRRGFIIATVPLLFTAAAAVATTFFLGQLGSLFGT